MLRPRVTLALLALTAISGLALFGFVRQLQAATPTAFSIESVGSQVGLGNLDLKEVIINVIKWALGFMSLTAVVYMMYGGYLWLTAAGNENRIEKAKQVILQAAIGMVIILLAWAIVLFVARTTANVTTNTVSNGGPGCTNINNCNPPSATSTFDITAVNTCTAPPDSWQDVPRSSAVSFTFNTDLQTTSHLDQSTPAVNTVQQAIGVGSDNLQINKCTDSTCTTLIDTDTNVAGTQNPKPIENQVYTAGSVTAGTATTPLAEWLANTNTLTFYHLSFSDTAADNRYFEPNTTYRITIPKGTNSKALQDIRDRALAYCRSNPGVGGAIAHCDDSPTDKIYYTFTTGNDTTGSPITTTSTVPNSDYLSNSGLAADRNVARSATLGISFSGGIDPASVTTDHFRVYKISGTPSDVRTGTCSNANCPATQVDPSKFEIRVNANGTGAWLQFKTAGEWFESFTWYRVEVDNFRNLCGTVAPARSWTFQTNDVTPGVDFVYPQNDFAYSCPSTEVFAQFKTSMWDITKSVTSCDVGQPSSFNTQTMVYDQTANAPVTTRTFSFTDQRVNPADDPNQFCKHLSFDPTSAGLPADHQYSVGLKSDMVINSNGDTLAYGDTVPGFNPPAGTTPWHFTTKPADQCFQAPYITQVSPGHDGNGACISVAGNYFDTTNDGQGANDTLALETVAQPSSTIKSWTNSSIVNRLNAGTLTPNAAGTPSYNYQVGVDYPAPVGKLLSQKTVASQFRLDPGTASNRPCLYALNPNQGYAGQTQFSAVGENFGTKTGPAEVRTTNVSPWSSGAWTDTTISDVVVHPNATTSPTKVRIHSSSGIDSNELPFTVLPNPGTGPGSGAPQVVDSATCNTQAGQIPSPNPYRNDTQACLNTSITARFTTALDPTTVTSSNVEVFSCVASVCTTPVAATILPGGTMITITPQADLIPATEYEVRLGTGVHSSAGIPMASAYTWRFTTKAGTDPCIVSDVALTPNGAQIVRDANYTPIMMNASPVDNACHTLTHAGLTFTWASTQSTVGQLGPTPITNTTDATKILTPPAGGATVGTTDVTVSLQSHTSTPFSLTYNPSACVQDSDCSTNALGESCGGSQCLSGICSPVVNALDKPQGPIATWTTVKGCWFGAYDPTNSKVIFNSSKEGVLPDPAQCGTNTWTNERIVREVPNGAVTGPVSVQRADAKTATLNSGFTVNTDPLAPGLCRIIPGSGLVDDPVAVDGRGFSTQGANDDVTYTEINTSVAHQATTYTNWADKNIRFHVPTDAKVATNDVRVVKGTQTSNSLPFIVQATPVQSCTPANQCIFGQDASCNPAGGNAKGCSYPGPSGLGCCQLRAKVVSTVPINNSTNICRNAVPQITFDQPLDPATVTTSSVEYRDGVTFVNGVTQTQNQNGQGTILYYPGQVRANTAQSLSITPAVPAAILPVPNASFEQADATGAPTLWDAIAKTKQSTDVPPSHTGFSALADCSTCTSAEQAYIAYNIPNTHLTSATYRVTGWVKASIKSGSKGGLITRCSAGNCPYDLFNNAPGLFNANSNGWQYIDMVLTNTAAGTADISLDCFANSGSKVWCDDISVTRVVPASGTEVRSLTGVIVDPTNASMSFTTAANLCTLDAISLTPSSWQSTSAGQTKNYTALPITILNNLRMVISAIPNVLEWKWNWTSEKPAVTGVAMTTADNANPSRATGTSIANGDSQICSTATITTDTFGGTANQKRVSCSQSNVAFCENPWTFSDSTDGTCDVTGGGCSTFNFDMSFCRDQAGQPLPNFGYTGVDGNLGSIEGSNTTDTTRLKSYFFKESKTSRDTIGLLIFKNPEFLSPNQWFTKRFPLDSGASSTVVAGYPAVRSGTTTYIGVTNLNQSGVLEGLMFVVDYNSNNAAAETVEIARRMLAGMVFNTNFTDVADKSALIRDTQRRQDMALMKSLLATYKTKNGSYPSLSGGTYIPGFTMSLWPSWQSTLSQDLGQNLPIDPVNTFSGACQNAGAEAATCWAESTKTFSCPVTPSNIYGYRVTPSGADLYTTMEYTGPGAFNSPPSAGICSGNNCDCFGYTEHLAP